jgi:uncharacterized membrane protein
MTTRPPKPAGSSRSWPVPAALVALSLIPLAGGLLRLVQLAGGPQLMTPDPRFAASPLPVVVHILGAAVYALVGAFQFVPRLRRRHPTWHRRAGRALTGAGLLVAGSGLWMTLLFPREPGTGELSYLFRLVFGSALAACLILGFSAIRGRDIAAHRRWMIRAYAIAMAAGTQAFTEGIGPAVFGSGPLVLDLSKGAGWVLNLAIAEWVIRRPARRRTARRRRALARSPQRAGALS